MTSISEAIFKGRIHTSEAVSPNFPKRDHTIMTSQLLARRAVEAVLAGGYIRCEDAREPAATPRAAEEKTGAAKGIIRYLLLWLGVFVLAGAIAIGTSRLPGHAVQAKPAERSALEAEVEEITAGGTVAGAPDLSTGAPAAGIPPLSTSSTSSTPSTPSIMNPAPAVAVQATQPISGFPPEGGTPKHPIPPQGGSTNIATAALAPVSSLQPAASSLGTPDDRPLGKTGVAADEVLYEGEPAARPAAEPEPRDHARPRPLASTVKPVPAPRRTAPSTKPAAQRLDTPKVEGIFWDKVRPMAIVNGDIVEVGAQVGPLKVVEIRPGVVTLADGDTRLALRP